MSKPAKAAKVPNSGKSKEVPDDAPAAREPKTTPPVAREPKNTPAAASRQQETKVATPASEINRLKLFDHLPKKKLATSSLHLDVDRSLHPATIKLGAMYRRGLIRDDDDRVAALLATFSNIIQDYSTPPNKTMSRELDKHIRNQVQHLVDCRQHSMGMGNLIKHIRFSISQIPPELSEREAKDSLIANLNAFLEERILFARESIVKICSNLIKPGDVVMTFGSSALIRQILIAAASLKSFRLIVIDTRPLCEGMATLEALSPLIECVYAPLSAAAAMMKDATTVLLGASALLSNGAMLAPAGTAMIAAIASAFSLPVIVAAESYKFSEKVQLDSIVFNELGSTLETVVQAAAVAGQEAELVSQLSTCYQGPLESSSTNKLPFQVINLRYDLTPINHISAVATETGLIPPTSIPVLIRELRSDQTSGN